MMYEQTLVKTLDNYIKPSVIKKNNRHKKWSYGYNPDHDIVIISKDGTLGDVIQIQNLVIGLPLEPENIYERSRKKQEQKWEKLDYPKELLKIKSVFDWEKYPNAFKEKWYDYIDEEFKRREQGFWFKNNGNSNYITGTHYMFLQWSKIDVGAADYRESNRLFFIFWEACKSDVRCYGMCYLKNRRSGFSFMASGETVNQATISTDSRFGILSKSGQDAKKMFTDKVVPISVNYPFFFKPIQDGTTNPRMELAFREPSKRITKKNKTAQKGEALNTVINWKNTTNNAYDGEKLHILYLDEAGKWEKPSDIRESWRIHRTCLLVGRKIVGKAMVGSTVNPLDRGGRQYRDLYDASNPLERNENGRTKSGLYSIFIPAYDALEGFFDAYGMPVVEDPEKEVLSIDGGTVSSGAKSFLKNERKALVDDSYELNEVIRQFPFTTAEAFRDSSKASLFNVQKIYEQIQYNQDLFPSPIVIGNFVWKDGVADTEVVFSPSTEGRWRIAWLPPAELRNKNKPENSWLGCGGVDSYDIDATVDGRGSKGACHMYNKFNMAHPSNMFVAEYASRPPLAKIFYEDVLMAAKFYGYPLLIENNKYGIARYFESRGYQDWLLDRPEHLGSGFGVKTKTKGIPSNSQDVIQAHAQSIEAYVHAHVGLNEQTLEFGKMYLDRTLEDWINFKVDDRTKFDLSISSGLALLAAQGHKPPKPKSDFTEKKFFRKGQIILR